MIKRRFLHFVEDPEKMLIKLGVRYFPVIVPDKLYLEYKWKKQKGSDLDWRNVRTLTEKMQWLKLYDRKSLYTTLVDKYRAKIWAERQFGDAHIIPTIATWKRAEDIDLSMLPEKFVLKCNHDCGSVFICRNKSDNFFYDVHSCKISFQEVKERLDKALKKNYYLLSREYAYKHIKRCILCETLLENTDGTLPNDYKLFYINGEFQFTYVSYDRSGINDRCTYDKNWNRLPFVWVEDRVYSSSINTSDVPCPKSYNDMLQYGKKIAGYFKVVRVDFYDVDGKMYLGEITPFHSGGYASFFPAKYDLIYGEKLKIK